MPDWGAPMALSCNDKTVPMPYCAYGFIVMERAKGLLSGSLSSTRTGVSLIPLGLLRAAKLPRQSVRTGC